jgi:nucleotide-binding universal stress UspA family protein
MKKILVAVDGAPISVHAARVALELATATRGTVTLVHVTPSVYGDAQKGALPEIAQAELAAGAKVLKEVNAQLTGGPLPVLSLCGTPAEVIAKAATDHGFELVVVGNKGRGAISRVLLGSVADRLTHICALPVMIVR